MTRTTARQQTLDRLQSVGADYSYERYGNGAVTLYVYPPVLGQDANGDWLQAIGPVQHIRFRADGSLYDV
jgi:hypothetical protein